MLQLFNEISACNAWNAAQCVKFKFNKRERERERERVPLRKKKKNSKLDLVLKKKKVLREYSAIVLALIEEWKFQSNLSGRLKLKWLNSGENGTAVGCVEIKFQSKLEKKKLFSWTACGWVENF